MVVVVAASIDSMKIHVPAVVLMKVDSATVVSTRIDAATVVSTRIDSAANKNKQVMQSFYII
jgi:hypothetical protein